MQPPLAARREQPIGHQHQQHLIPTRAFAAGGKPLAPETIELQLLPQLQRQPARTPLPRPPSRSCDSFSRTIAASATTLTAVLRKQRQRARCARAVLQHRDRPPPRQFLRVVDLPQIQHVPLHHASAADTPVLDNAPVAVLLAVLLASRRAQKHDGAQLSAEFTARNRQGLHYSRICAIRGARAQKNKSVTLRNNAKIEANPIPTPTAAWSTTGTTPRESAGATSYTTWGRRATCAWTLSGLRATSTTAVAAARHSYHG